MLDEGLRKPRGGRSAERPSTRHDGRLRRRGGVDSRALAPGQGWRRHPSRCHDQLGRRRHRRDDRGRVRQVGKEGVVSIEDGTGIETEVEVVEGMQFDRGYISAHLVTDLQNMESVLNDARVLVTDAKISSVSDLLPSLELVMRAGRPLLIIAEDIQAEALATLVVNRARGTFSAMAVKAPAFGERREAILQDIAVLTGATVISEKTGLRLDAVRDDQLGVAGRVTVTKDETTIVRGGGSKAAIRCTQCGDPPPDGGDDLRLDREKASRSGSPA